MSATSGAIVLGRLTFPSVITPARGASRTITIGMYSGPRTEIVKDTVIKRLEEKHNVKILVVVIAAALETVKPFQEAQYETDAAFKKLAELKLNLHSIFTQNALVMAAFQQGEVVLTGPFYSSNIWPCIDSGLPANHIIPKEGGFAGLGCQTLVHGGPYLELGAEFINEILAPETQAMLCQKLSTTPVVQGVALPAPTLERLAYDEGKAERLFVSDWKFINKIRPEWPERWNKIFS
jgi:putative spermidine/putrescine transport system substrate-binding protein